MLDPTASAASRRSDARQRGRSRVLTPGLVAGFAGIVVVLVAARFVGLANLRDVDASRAAVAHTHQVKAGLDQLLATLIDAETGERGFIITGTDNYLEPYDRARGALPSDIAQVRALIADNPEQQADLDHLADAIALKLSELAEGVRQRRVAGFEAAQGVVRTSVGKRTMDGARAIVSRMEAREDARLAERTAQAAQSYSQAVSTGFVSTGIALLVVMLLFVVTRRAGVERLRAAEVAERLRVTLASIGDAVITTDEHGRIMRLNAVAESLTGWSEAEATGRRLEEVFVIVNEETRRPAENPIERALRDRVVVGLANHTVLISKDGREIPVDDSAAPIKTEDGLLAGAIMVFRDVSDRRRIDRERAAIMETERLARVEAEQAEGRLQIALQAGRMGTWQFTMRSGEVKWSAALEAIHGLEPGAFPGTFEAFEQEIHPDDRDRVLRAISDAVDERRDHEIEYRIVRSDGAVRWIEERGRLFTDAGGQPERMVGVCTDITERKRAEEKFRLAVQAAPAAMIMVDRRGAIHLVNPLTEQLLGYTQDELIGQSIERLVPPRFRDRHAGFRAAFHTDSRSRPMGEGRDLYAVRKDGSEVPVEIGLSPVETPDGPFVLAAVTDITERKRTAALLQQAVEAERAATHEAQHANALKDQFLAMVSHELRAPLNAVLGWADMLRTGTLEEARRQRALDAVFINAQRQVQLIDDLLDIARIVSGKMRIAPTAVNLPTVVRGALDGIEPSADAKRIQIRTDLDAAIGDIVGDGARLQQVIGNLLTNAVKFTPEDGAIHLSVRRADHAVEIGVTDNGQGIPAEFLPWVFEPFRQAASAPTRTHGGLGLGLAIVKHLVEAHGGSVAAESGGEGQGSTFTVRLPLERSPK